MKAKKDKSYHSLRIGVMRISRVHFLYVLAFVVQLIVFDASKLITADVVLKRWYLAVALLLTTTVVWYISHIKNRSVTTYKALVWSLIVVDIAVAGVSVYLQRGMAARAVMLFSIPIVVSSVLKRSSAIYATAVLCMAVYFTAAIKYFVDFFNEGYKVELYGEVGFYCAIFIILAALLASVVQFSNDS